MATPREVKKGYMKQVLKYHPDKNDSPDATEKFIEVTTGKQFYYCVNGVLMTRNVLSHYSKSPELLN